MPDPGRSANSTTITLTRLEAPPPHELPVEIVERKGLGHPDTICDALAERVSRALARYYLERFGLILHHNVDKVLLVGGTSRPAFGGGEIVHPIEIYFAGRATDEFKGVRIPVGDIVVAETRAWFQEHCRAIDPVRHVVVRPLVRPGSADLVDLYLRQQGTGTWLANDTSCGVGFAPLDPLETAVARIERALNSRSFRTRHPEGGEDVKVMGVRRNGRTELTIARAMIDRHLTRFDDYAAKLDTIARAANHVVPSTIERPIISVNAADDLAAGSVYLTVTGLSAEAGDDGEAGRGNRVNGLITPCRPMTMESVAGKNPVTHVGKIYNVVASLVAADIVAEIPGADSAECYLVSRIGLPVSEPAVVDVRIRGSWRDARPAVDRIVGRHLGALDELARRLVAGDIAVDQWPLDVDCPAHADRYAEVRRRLVEEIHAQARASGDATGRPVFDDRVLDAMARVPRHEFVPRTREAAAYDNRALPIGHGQTISQPFVVALMTDLLDLEPGDRVLEIGTGSGYQAAILAELAAEVDTIEIVPDLAAQAKARLARLGYDNVTVRTGDGYAGWPERAPFDAIIVTAGAPAIPPPLVAQLAPGGRLVIPVGGSSEGQELVVLEKTADGDVRTRAILPVTFVPLVGATPWRRASRAAWQA